MFFSLASSSSAQRRESENHLLLTQLDDNWRRTYLMLLLLVQIGFMLCLTIIARIGGDFDVKCMVSENFYKSTLSFCK